MEYSKLTSGEQYTISDIFSRDNRITIPDLQRDYCWGNENSDATNLVEGFISNLIDNQDQELNMGLLYGYSEIEGHINLCDGQQRITTLFLLLGMLNRTSNNELQKYLISDYELKDDREPYLQYSIRESSLYFLSDLVFHYFINDKQHLKVKDIPNQSWYFKDYDLDPSIQSMLLAMKTIERLLESVDDHAIFANRIITNVSFIYYDMKNRKNGEETFVIINTTGEPLSATENLKPLLINAQKPEKQEACSELWEKYETWFWKHRGVNDTADNGLNEFFRWITLLNTKDDDVFKLIQKTGTYKFDVGISFDEIDHYFRSVEWVFEEILNNNKDWLAPASDGNRQINWFRLLPVIEYVKRYGHENPRNIKRVKIFFKNLAQIPNVQSSIGTILKNTVYLIENLNSADIADIVNIPDVSKMILSEEEKLKFSLFTSTIYNRDELEDLFWKAQEHGIWKGEIMPLLTWATQEGEQFNLNSFKAYNKMFNELFNGEIQYDQRNKELDVIRIALLTRKLDDCKEASWRGSYPRIFEGDTNSSFCWKPSHWQTLIKENIAKFGTFLLQLINSGDYKTELNNMTANYVGDWAEFVEFKELLEYCTQKNIQWSGKELGWILISGHNKRGAHANLKSYRLYMDFKKVDFISTTQKLGFHHKGRTCAYVDKNDTFDTAIDIFHSGEDKYCLELFSRNDKLDVKSSFAETSEVFGLEFGDNDRYNSEPLERDAIIDLTKRILNQ